MLGDAETLLGFQLQIGVADFLGADKRQARLVGIEGGAIIGILGERGRKHGQRIGALGRGARQIIGVQRIELRLAEDLAVGAAERIRGARRLQPEIAIVRGERQRAVEGFQRSREIVGGQVEAGGSRQVVDRLAFLRLGQLVVRLVVASLLDDVSREEIEARGSAQIRLLRNGCGRRLDDAPGDCAREGVHGLEVGFQETPLDLRIIGEGLAALVADAGSLALVERDVLLGPQIEAEEIGVLDRLDIALLVCGSGRKADCKCRQGDGGEGEKRAYRHQVPPVGWR